MQLAFYHGDGNLITDLIRVITWGQYSHVELVFSNGAWFSVSGRGKAGVRWNKTGPEKGTKGWHLVDLPSVASGVEERAISYANTHLGKAFSWKGLVSFVIPVVKKDPDTFFCSEIVVRTLQEGAALLPSVQLKISPNKLYEMVTNLQTAKPYRSLARLAALATISVTTLKFIATAIMHQM